MVTVPLSYTTELLYYHFCVKVVPVVQICVRKARQVCVAPSLICSNVEVVRVFKSICCHGGTVGLKEDVKDSIRKIVWSSFKWLLVMDSAWMWNLSIVLRWGRFLWRSSTCIILFIGPKEHFTEQLLPHQTPQTPHP